MKIYRPAYTPKKYRLEYTDLYKTFLNFEWDHTDDSAAGDFYVKAVEAKDVAVDVNNRTENKQYTIPMIMEKARSFIQRFGEFSTEVRGCKGLSITTFTAEEYTLLVHTETKLIDFSEPVKIRTIDDKV